MKRLIVILLIHAKCSPILCLESSANFTKPNLLKCPQPKPGPFTFPYNIYSNYKFTLTIESILNFHFIIIA